MKNKYWVMRILRTIITAFGVTLIAFLILHLTPGDPARIMLGPYASEENLAAVRAKYKLDQPLYTQYISWMGNVFKGDFGTSIRYNRDVGQLIAERAGPTLILTGSGLLIAVIFGVLLGILAALKRNSFLDYFTTFQAMFWISIPSFWLGILLLYIFGLQLRWVPIAGLMGFSSLILPALSIGLREEAWFARPMRSEMLEVLNQDYIKAAKAKGLKYSVVVMKHALRNALIPIVTMLALRLPWIIGGAVVIEVVFSWGGLGSLLVNSVLARDYPVVQSILLLISITVVLANLLADIIYAVVDPRIKGEG
ncbi:ABC transporter permease [Geotoga petraea]|jgi:ABC-type dipeptide/oligopeptide/nickel transport system permease component|uniref:ABC transporter permease n=1 Tax=Geotoga petraea TaxID=28234 RepID=A0A1G6HXJ5_9BACT|nr:ABC transporter permease [Geotoga petraea]MDK2945346.1 peptide/nickel transport system permease protein [Geotoga sp.]TGG89008.1 ABC transporter permease [Geotoga petraea]SDB98863.1 peptide/nickel transport system permease protein [Geotoga petraea]